MLVFLHQALLKVHIQLLIERIWFCYYICNGYKEYFRILLSTKRAVDRRIDKLSVMGYPYCKCAQPCLIVNKMTLLQMSA